MTSRRPAEARRGQPAIEEGERIGVRLVAIFCVGVVLFSPLVIDIFDRGPGARVFGLPLLYFYLFAAWALLIALLAWVLESRPRAKGGMADQPPDDQDFNGVPT